MIYYHVGDATDPGLEGRFVIAHVLSDTGAYGKGFAAAVARRYPRARRRFKAWARGDRTYVRPFELGSVQWVGVGADVDRAWRFGDRWVVNMVAMRGLRSASNPHPLDLDALARCLVSLAKDLGELPVVMPRIGCDLAGGTWDEVGPLVEETLVATEVHVYDLEREKR